MPNTSPPPASRPGLRPARSASPPPSPLPPTFPADAEHTPAAGIEAWLEAGPLRVRRYFAERLAVLPGLRLDDPYRAVLHFTALIGPDPIHHPSDPDRDH